MLKGTTVASGEWEGMRRDEHGAWTSWYHGYYPRGTPQGASFLYWVDGKPDSDRSGCPSPSACRPARLRDSQGDDAMLARMRTRTNPCLATHQKQTVSVDVIVLVSDQVLTPWRVVTSRTMLPLESYAVVSA